MCVDKHVKANPNQHSLQRRQIMQPIYSHELSEVLSGPDVHGEHSTAATAMNTAISFNTKRESCNIIILMARTHCFCEAVPVMFLHMSAELLDCVSSRTLPGKRGTDLSSRAEEQTG